MLFKDCICFRLGTPRRKLTRAYQDSPASIGLTHGQFLMRFALFEENGAVSCGQSLWLLVGHKRKRLQLTLHSIRYRKGLSGL
ncbi:hypothetical protein [Desulfoferrobacter suflitae]|uniref:hypothetical protein n=1 Tax=Desulfoferrobacter suflitae TaxID=2865782 RepID=UPI002164C375|nr:hypothetical protein [Desulfoferrobacter suflitae]MCK8601326.1 hypothetical protein [Desulfoferrobacter suflitae]